MGKRLYVFTRDLHLYAGLFLSPFVVLFAVSVFYLAHSRECDVGISGMNGTGR